MSTIRQVCAGMALIVLLAAASPARAQSTVDLVNLFDGPCERYGVPKPLALAIAGHESGGRPWAMNIAGRPVLHASKDEALSVARAALAAGLSFDIGLMQVNAQWLRRYRLTEATISGDARTIQIAQRHSPMTAADRGNAWKPDKRPLLAAFSAPNAISL